MQSAVTVLLIALIVNVDMKTTAGLRIVPHSTSLHIHEQRDSLSSIPIDATLSIERSKRSHDATFHDERHMEAYSQLMTVFVENYFKLVAATRLPYLCERMRGEL